jgi:acetylornithine deacetylase
MIDDRETLELLRQLVRIESVNPDLVTGGSGELEIARFTSRWLSRHGLPTRVLADRAGRASVLAVASGSGGGRSIMLNGHLDTVALTSYAGDGLDPVIHDDNLYGRGAYDMKSGVAALMIAAADAASAPHRGDIVVALVADEEWASAGTEEVLRHVVTDTAIVVEPSGLDIVTAHRGFVWAEVTVHGVAAHGSRPDLGVDAIAKSGRFLTALDDVGSRLAGGAAHPVLGAGSIHASTIAGGVEASTYPDRCTIVVERRTVPGEDASTVEQELRAILDDIASSDATFRYEVAITAHRSPFEAAADSVVVSKLTDAFRAITGSPPRRRGEPFWTDCALLSEAGIDTALFGVDGGGAHAAAEWVTISSLHVVTRVLAHAVRSVSR